MPLEDADKKFIQDQIKTSLDGFMQPLEEKFTQMVAGNNKRIYEQMESKIGKNLGDLGIDTIKESLLKQGEALEQLTKASSTSPAPPTGKEGQPATTPAIDDSRYKELTESLKNQSTKLDSLTTQLTEAEKQRQAALEQASAEKARTDFITALNGKASMPAEFYTLLTASDKAKVIDGELRVSTGNFTNEGEPEFVAATKQVDKLLEVYPIFKEVRGGTGAGNIPGVTPVPTPTTSHLSQYANWEGGVIDATDLHVKMQDPKVKQEVMTEAQVANNAV